VFKKCKEQLENILFIDASQGFEKRGNQNYLRTEDINRIITTYKERAADEKYSYVGTLGEVKENDYNLNIPRYVDTFDEEELVDLEATAKELKDLELAMSKTDEVIADYCKQLGISAP
jgi:type I restriction enzyme M protein